MDTEAIGNYIRSIRKEKGLSQEKLAELVDVSPRTIGNWESGKVEIAPAHREQLAKALGISSLEVLAGKNLDQLDTETKAILDERIRETSEVTIILEDRNILSLDLAIYAMGFAYIALGMCIWAVFRHTALNLAISWFVAISGIVFILFGRIVIKKMGKMLKERKQKISVSE